MKKFIIILLILVVILVTLLYLPRLTLYLYDDDQQVHNTYSDEAIDDALRGIAEKWSKELPQVMDITTTLMSVSVNEPRTLTYKYFIDSSLILVSLTEMEDLARTGVVNQFCTDPKQEFARENNVTYDHRYFDLTNSYLFSVSVSNTDCI